MKTKPEVSHTPTPWKVSIVPSTNISGIKRNFYSIGLNRNDKLALVGPNQKENAAFIVRAVNAHEELERIALMATYSECDETNNCAHCLAKSYRAEAERGK